MARHLILAGGCAAALLIGLPAQAAEPGLLDQLARCGAVANDAARLACYDGLKPRVDAALHPGGAPAPAAKQEEKSWFGFDMGDLFGTSPETQTTPQQFGAEKTPEAQARRDSEEKALDSISEKLEDYAYNPYGKFMVTLANGQIWKQLQSDDGRAYFEKNPAANTVTIARGLLGSYVLSINGGNRAYKVTRVK